MDDVGGIIAALCAAAQQEPAELFALLAWAPGRLLLARLGPPGEEATPAQVAAFLDGWRFSRFLLLRSAYGAARSRPGRLVWTGRALAGDRLPWAAAAAMNDPLREGLRTGWQVIDAARPTADRELEADVAIVDSGAGGGIAAEILTRAG